ncbi:hypothetical protein WG66_004410, partial [Moniliophthora roreri]
MVLVPKATPYEPPGSRMYHERKCALLRTEHLKNSEGASTRLCIVD